jgi:hypothetical protein
MNGLSTKFSENYPVAFFFAILHFPAPFSAAHASISVISAFALTDINSFSYALWEGPRLLTYSAYRFLD